MQSPTPVLALQRSGLNAVPNTHSQSLKVNKFSNNCNRKGQLLGMAFYGML